MLECVVDLELISQDHKVKANLTAPRPLQQNTSTTDMKKKWQKNDKMTFRNVQRLLSFKLIVQFEKYSLFDGKLIISHPSCPEHFLLR